jgi:hypothetical protein
MDNVLPLNIAQHNKIWETVYGIHNEVCLLPYVNKAGLLIGQLTKKQNDTISQNMMIYTNHDEKVHL